VVYKGITDPASLESMACREALALAEDLALTTLIVASDCKGVVIDIAEGTKERYAAIIHWWKKGLPFDRFVLNQIRSAAKGSISPGSFENMGQGALVPVQKRPSVPVSSNSRD
jgi:hypothetical protein